MQSSALHRALILVRERLSESSILDYWRLGGFGRFGGVGRLYATCHANGESRPGGGGHARPTYSLHPRPGEPAQLAAGPCESRDALRDELD